VGDRGHEHVTEAQRERLAAELADLEHRRHDLVVAIKAAREFGDLAENFEYHAAKNEQGLLEARIRRLRSRLDDAVVVEAHTGDVVAVGSRVEIEDDDGRRMEIEISSVGGAGAVSPSSPLGAALLGAAVGESVEVAAPRGAWTARVVAIRQADR
jgi:transcription elongation factor GreA